MPALRRPRGTRKTPLDANELTFLLATDHRLWRILALAVCPEHQPHVDARTGRPFTLPTGSLGVDDALRLDHSVVAANAMGSALRAVAARCGGRYDHRTGEFSGCCLGLSPGVWVTFSR